MHFAQILPTLCVVSPLVSTKETSIAITAEKKVTMKIPKIIIEVRAIRILFAIRGKEVSL
jgi:hypothetical protein